ncbi:radical SAM protein [bacterium]|nr:radical SAM protein [bacterium]RQV99337.1 MAG: radical SAM protein [bacterium]
MAKASNLLAVEAAFRWIWNTLMQKPWAISIEVTHNCTANCKHCDKGEKIPDEKQATPEEYRKIYNEIHPLVVQISGGEPLLRKDILDIVRIFKNPGHLPYIVFVTNASLLTEEKYDQLKEAGVDQFSISLDFPDERHDQNRRLPGLFQHLSDVIPILTAKGNNDITVITAVTRENYPCLIDNLHLVGKWGARLNLSMYTAGRTGNRDLLITSEEDLAAFRKIIDQIIEEKRNGACIFSSEAVLNRYYDFFANGRSPGKCKAGIRSLVVNPDGSLCPGAMKKDFKFKSQKELRKKFSKNNQCDQCFISLRANTEKPLREVVRDILATV